MGCLSVQIGLGKGLGEVGHLGLLSTPDGVYVPHIFVQQLRYGSFWEYLSLSLLNVGRDGLSGDLLGAGFIDERVGEDIRKDGDHRFSF